MTNRLPSSTAPVHYSLTVIPVPSTREKGGFEVFDATVRIDVEFKEATNKIVLNSKSNSLYLIFFLKNFTLRA